jgi:hypothetical protein
MGETVVIKNEPEGSTYLHPLNLLDRELPQVPTLECKLKRLLRLRAVVLAPRFLEGICQVHYGTQLASEVRGVFRLKVFQVSHGLFCKMHR